MSVITVAPVAERLTPIERLEVLCDPDSVHVLRSRVTSPRLGARAVAGDGVVGATGTVAGRPIVCYAQDGAYLGGSLGERHAETIIRVLELAGRGRIPVVAFVESGGARMQEGAAALGGYGRIFRQTVALTGVVPQISIVSGASAGGGAYSPALTDLIVMTQDAAMFLTGPGIVREALGEEIDAISLGGPRVHDRNGVCQLVEADVRSAALRVRELLSYLPSCAGERPPRALSAQPALADPGAEVPSEPRRTYDVRRPLKRSSTRDRCLSSRPGGRATWSPRSHGSTAVRSGSSQTSPAISVACSTPRGPRRPPGSCGCATRSRCRSWRSSIRPGSCRAAVRSRPA